MHQLMSTDQPPGVCVTCDILNVTCCSSVLHQEGPPVSPSSRTASYENSVNAQGL